MFNLDLNNAVLYPDLDKEFKMPFVSRIRSQHHANLVIRDLKIRVAAAVYQFGRFGLDKNIF